MQLSTPAREWAQRLVRFNTVSRESNLPLIECIADHLRSLQVPIRLTYDDERRKANLFATIGAGKPDGVILSGHTDTVPWDGQAWTRDPLDAKFECDRLYGRGSADMKGFIGLVVAQTERYLAADLPHAIHYAFSFDEELGCFAAPVHRWRADRHGAGDCAQGRLPLALLHQGQTGAFVADPEGRQRNRGRRAAGGAHRGHGRCVA
jgi:acetylornithine deacetylase/succinyl-diaminopimelate desuccinylase-like protein